MSCHLSRRLTLVHRAVSMAMLCSIGWAVLIPSVQAATIGKTVVTSAQHEPLAASIAVSNIEAADFSASLANSTVYQQMGLSPTDSMMVRFQPTSATSGQLLITTSQPVSKPFADVVLAINDNGQRNMLPKTLLMPLKESLPINTSNTIATAAKKPNLPSVSASTAMPLTVRRGAPPPLISVSAASSPKLSSPQLSPPKASTSELLASQLATPKVQAPTVTVTSQVNRLAYAPSRLDNGRLNRISGTDNNSSPTDNNRGNLTNSMSDSLLSTASSNSGSAATDNSAINERPNKNTVNTVAADKPKTNQQLDILNIQVTRQIQPSSKADVIASSPLVPTSKPISVSTIAQDASDTTMAVAQDRKTADSTALSAPPPNNSTAASNKVVSSATTQYQVQRNDSLWVIAQQIAEENNLDTPTVMKQIQSQNPDAFINKDANQLKADAKLNLPSYDIIPSQQSLEAAISAQRQYNRRANTPVIKKAAPSPTKKSSETAQIAKRAEKPTTTKTKILPQAQFSVLAPGSDGNADGTQEKSAADTGNGLSTDILATLKSSRQGTATQAKRLSKTSSTLNSYTKKLQLQNQKLAELQARLKKLRNQ